MAWRQGLNAISAISQSTSEIVQGTTTPLGMYVNVVMQWVAGIPRGGRVSLKLPYGGRDIMPLLAHSTVFLNELSPNLEFGDLNLKFAEQTEGQSSCQDGNG
jgi:hypothetical protein